MTAAATGTIKVLLCVAIIVCPIIGCLCILAGMIDFSRVRSFKRPIFCILPTEFAAEDDGGSGTYVGFCYSFEIKGSFMPEDEPPGVTQYTARIFNTPVMAGVQD